MPAPQTPFEATGNWTPTEDFPQAIADMIDGAPTPAQAWYLGLSAGGRPIHAARVGNPDATSRVFIVCGQHGNEVASGESGLGLLRDLAWAVAPDLAAYVATHEVILIPLASPDGRVKNFTTNDLGYNCNREHLKLRAIENVYQQRLIERFDPVVVMDCHENGRNDGLQFEGLWGKGDGVHAAVAEMGKRLVDEAMIPAAQDAYGVTAGYYLGDFPESTLTNTAALRCIPGLLTETLTNMDPTTRVGLQRAAQNAVLAFHAAHHRELRAAVEEARSAAATDPADPAGWTLTPSQVRATQGHREIFDIRLTTGTFVPRTQPARGVVDFLYGPTSAQRIAAGVATTPAPPAPAPPAGASGDILGLRWNGVTHPVAFRQDGTNRSVTVHNSA